MPNKKIKKMYEEKFNKDENYNNIINKLQNKKNHKINFKWSLIPICLLLCLTIPLFSTKDFKLDDEKQNIKKDIININSDEIKYFTEIIYVADIAGRCEILTKESINNKFPFIEKSNINYPHETFYAHYSHGLEGNIDQYDNLVGYYLMYSSNDYEDRIEIFISETTEIKPRDVGRFEIDDLDNSEIDGVNIKIIGDNNYYIALFKLNGLFLDIGANHMNEKEFIHMIKQIIYWNKYENNKPSSIDCFNYYLDMIMYNISYVIGISIK